MLIWFILQWTKAPPNEKLCVVITTTYEVNDDEDAISDNESECDMEQGVCPQEVVPGPRVSFYTRLFSGTHNVDSSVTIHKHDDIEKDAGSDDAFTVPQRKRIGTDFTADTSDSLSAQATGSSSKVPSTLSRQISSFNAENDNVETIPEGSEKSHNFGIDNDEEEEEDDSSFIEEDPKPRAHEGS